MRQRNDTHEALYVQRADPPFWVKPGEAVEFDAAIVGLTPITDEPDVQPTASKKAKSTSQAGEGDAA